MVTISLTLLALASTAHLISGSPIVAPRQTASPALIAIGYFGEPCAGCYHAERVAWDLPTNTTDPGYAAACTEHVTIATLSLSGWSSAVCGTPFAVGGVANLTLHCADEGVNASNITAIYAADGSLYETCTPVAGSMYNCGPSQAGPDAFIQQLYTCQ
jgi:hypothetical protein